MISNTSLRLNIQTEYCELATIVLQAAINLKFKSVNTENYQDQEHSDYTLSHSF